jgi:hypothetical protein
MLGLFNSPAAEFPLLAARVTLGKAQSQKTSSFSFAEASECK